MNSPTASEVASLYDKTAVVYDVAYVSEQLRKYHVVVSLLCPQPGDVILDAGCGSGRLLSLIYQSCSAAVGLDVSRGQLTLARARLREAGNVLLVVGDFDYLPFRVRSFTSVVAVTSLHHSRNLRRATKELLALIKKRAVFSMLKCAISAEELEELTVLSGFERTVEGSSDIVVTYTTRTCA